MILDTHIHIDNFAKPEPERLLRSMDQHGVGKLAMLAEEPLYSERNIAKLREHNNGRIERMMQWCRETDGRLLPIYFIDPTEPEASMQVDQALEAGAVGFKVICENFYPGDERAMPVYQHIADLDKAILFHSGILWDYGDNGNYNRPCNWECMLNISNIRFALAHISWPWCDEAIALYGKFCAMEYSPKYKNQKMYIDMTPGTPACYRQRVLDTLYQVDYAHMNERLLFGSDSFTGEYDAIFAKELAESDTVMLKKAGFDEATCRRIMGQNAVEFWGI